MLIMLRYYIYLHHSRERHRILIPYLLYLFLFCLILVFATCSLIYVLIVMLIMLKYYIHLYVLFDLVLCLMLLANATDYSRTYYIQTLICAYSSFVSTCSFDFFAGTQFDLWIITNNNFNKALVFTEYKYIHARQSLIIWTRIA